ncbi:S-adenosyl-L-methionine-dependent methyltransferase [Lasiosphaeria miniovina]|uniref:S-adenosyl-L-methionine-dependent methyltransferase n=1 Tax=Lasiosphaeria miniovina TaxID=1954250 RepID=A0AA40A6N4_9PEZI|nr:S-adenosyl-L-methionine-dependent methyltransferase [Lasiosphaeria miniovina]KAK0710297.1 S-adenosyl-L-methionine-dependent methyltransferase [Lasiosphaeria miniovina]
MGSQHDSASIDVSVALAPCDLEAVLGLVGNIASLSKDLTATDHETRLKVLADARALVQALETPRETMLRHLWTNGTSTAALAIGVETGLFVHMLQNNGAPKKVPEIAEALGAESDLLARIMRYLASMGYIAETGINEFAPTNFSKAMAIPLIGNGYPSGCRLVIPGTLKLPEHMRECGYRPSTDTSGLSAFQRANGTTLDCFSYIYSLPGEAEYFSQHMAASRLGTPRWMDVGFYPVARRLIHGADDDKDSGVAFLVDVAGSTGHDIKAFRQEYPDAPGRLVLQDLPKVIATAATLGLDPKIELMEHDFFTEQPLKGARTYYMHRVLHDWSDEEALRILKHIKDAMRPGYSRLLIIENVIPAKGARWEMTATDLIMLMFTGAKERTETDWRALLEKSAGLRVTGIWTGTNSLESLIECERVS